MEYFEFIKFYRLAKDKEKEERIFNQWVVQLPLMTQDKYISFKDYKDKVTAKNIDTRSTEVILTELDEIEKKLTERG